MERYNNQEIKILRRLDSPKKVQDFLESLKVNFEKNGETCRSPRLVLKHKTAHCMEAALLAAAALEFHRFKPFLMDLRAEKKDLDHVVAVFKQFGCFGAISKTNHAVLRYREPIYKTLRELALSYFHEYFTDQGEKTLREYSAPVNLNKFNKLRWRTSEEDLWEIPEAVDKARHFKILSLRQIKLLRKADPIEIQAGKLVEYK